MTDESERVADAIDFFEANWSAYTKLQQTWLGVLIQAAHKGCESNVHLPITESESYRKAMKDSGRGHLIR